MMKSVGKHTSNGAPASAFAHASPLCAVSQTCMSVTR